MDIIIEGDFNFGNMVAKSKAMQDIFQMAEKVARYKTTVLILGDSGQMIFEPDSLLLLEITTTSPEFAGSDFVQAGACGGERSI